MSDETVRVGMKTHVAITSDGLVYHDAPKPPTRLIDAKTDREQLEWAQRQVLALFHDYGDEDVRNSALLGFGIVMGYAIKGLKP